jgi:uncharacterized protein YndB with AHSA1/START domain
MREETDMAKTDTITRSITVGQPIQRVWRALTEAEHLAVWFGDSAEIDLRAGGGIRVGWSEYDSQVDGVVEEVDPPNRFAFSWSPHATPDGRTWSTKVVFDLEEADSETTVTVVESGFAALPDEIYEERLASNSGGWDHELADLQRMLEEVTTA